MNTNLDLTATAISAPLTMKEIAEVSAPFIVMDALIHRAITEAGLWARTDELRSVAESVLEDFFISADANLNGWLADMKSSGAPRLCSEVAKLALLKQALESGHDRFLARQYPADPDYADHNNAEANFIDAIMDRTLTGLTNQELVPSAPTVQA